MRDHVTGKALAARNNEAQGLRGKERLKNKKAFLTKILPTHAFRTADNEPSHPPNHAISLVYPGGQRA